VAVSVAPGRGGGRGSSAGEMAESASVSRMKQRQTPPTESGGTSSSMMGGGSDVSTKINALMDKIAVLETAMDDSSVTEARRYAMKKEMAMARANVKRLQREAQQRG
jgi:hypothetical protein